MHSNLKGIVLQTKFEEINELMLFYLIEVHLEEMKHIVLFTVHLEDQENFLWRHKESFTVVLSDSLLNLVVDENLLKEGLVVLSVGVAFKNLLFHVK